MQYQRKRKVIQQRIIKSNNTNFRTNYTNVSKTNESTKEESKFIQPWKISSIQKYEKNTKYIIQNDNSVNEKEQIYNVSQKNINNDNSQENKISMVEVNWENKNKSKILNKVYTNPYTTYNNYSNLYNQNYNNSNYNNYNNNYKNNYGISYNNDYNNNVSSNGYNYSINERDTSYPRFEKDNSNSNSNSNIISLRIRKTQKSSSNISNLRNSNTSDYNTYYQNSIFKESNKQKDENKSNSFESLTSQNTNNYNYKSNSIRNNNSKVNSIRNTYKQNIVLKKNITTNYSNYYISNNITPKKNNEEKSSIEKRKQSFENSKMKSELDTINCSNSNNDSNRCILRQKRIIDMKAMYEGGFQNFKKNNEINVQQNKEIGKENEKESIKPKYSSSTYKDLKKISKKFNKIYEIDKSGILIKDTQVILPGASDEIFNNRKRVLSKINRLSNILLSKNKKEKNSIRTSSGKRTNEKGSSRTGSCKSLLLEDSIKHKFLYISLAIGRNFDDKKIVRGTRGEKGGVVDLTSEIIKNKQFKIIKAKKGGNFIFPKKENIPKIREKSAKIIQKWWRLYKLIFMTKFKQIIFIQSCWRGFWIRKNVFDLLYLNYLYISFSQRIQIILDNKRKKEAFEILASYNYKDKHEAYNDDNKNKIVSIVNIFNLKKLMLFKEFIDKFCYFFKKENIKGKNLMKIKSAQENKLKILHSAFTSWAYKTKIRNYEEEVENKIYDTNIIIQEIKMKQIVNKKIVINNNLLRKYFYQWYINSLQFKHQLSLDQNNQNLFSIKLKLFILIIETIFNKHKTKLLKHFYQIIRRNDKSKDENNKKKEILKNIEDINNGYKLLERYTYRNTYLYPFYCIMDKINNENIDVNLMKILRTKKRSEKDLLKDIFHIWKNKVQLAKKNDLIKELFIKVINIFHKSYIKQLLIKKFYQWKNISKNISIKVKSLTKGKKILLICDSIKINNILINGEKFFYCLKNLKKRINMKDLQFIKKVLTHINKRKNDSVLQKSFNKWNNFVIKYEILVLKGTIILNLYSKHKSTNKKVLLFKYFNKWIANTNILTENNKTENILSNLEIDSKASYRQIQIIILKSILRKMNKNYINNKLYKYFIKWAYTKVTHIDNINISSKLTNLFINIPSPDALNSRILHKKFLNWKNIINNSKLKVILLQKIFDRNNKKKINLIRHYINKWLVISNYIKMDKYSSIIVEFCRKKLKISKAIKQWLNLSNKLKSKNRNCDINNAVKKMKKFKVVDKMVKIIRKESIRISYKKIAKIKYVHIFINKIGYCIEKVNNKNNDILLNKYFMKWKEIIIKMNSKENVLKNMMAQLKLHSINNSVSTINKYFLIKKLIKFISVNEAIIKKKSLIQYDEEFILNQKKLLIDKIHKLNTYKILNNFCNYYDMVIKKKIFIYKIRLFLALKNENENTTKEFEYTRNISDEKNIINKTHFKNHLFTKNNIRNNDINYKKNLYLILMPSFMKYLSNKFLLRKISAFDQIKQISNSNEFCNKLKHFTNKEIKSYKIDLVKNLKKDIIIEYKNRKKTDYNNFYRFIKKLYIRKITKIIKTQSHYKKLLYLIKITKTHKSIAKSIWLLKIIKKWRFVTFLKKIFSKKMTLMYNNLQVGYMDLLDKVINEDCPVSKSDVDRMSRLDMKQYLYNYEDPLLIKNNNISNEERNKFAFPNLNKEYYGKNNKQDMSRYKYKIDESSELSQEINEENNEKDISFMEKKFIKDNVNYMYVSYDDSSSICEEK